MHDLDNLYVADSSFFVSSTAVNPTLTIIANALRVADRHRRAAGGAGRGAGRGRHPIGSGARARRSSVTASPGPELQRAAIQASRTSWTVGSKSAFVRRKSDWRSSQSWYGEGRPQYQ